MKLVLIIPQFWLLLQVCQEVGMEPPLAVSMKLHDSNNLYSSIVSAAERPHSSIPETEAGKISKQYRQLVNRSLICVSGIVNL